MTNKEAARYSLQRAQVILGEVEHLRAQGVWNLGRGEWPAPCL